MRLLSVLAGVGVLSGAALSQTVPTPAAAPAATPAPHAEAKAIALGKVSAAYFLGLQELPAFTPDEMTQRHQGATGDPEALAADQALNDWKLCAIDSITHWADLKPGRGEIVDGAMGRCVDIEHDYRNHLLKIAQDGRMLFDLSFARQMAKSLEDAWRPRLLAAALDHDLEVAREEKEKEKEKPGGRRKSGQEARSAPESRSSSEPPTDAASKN
jgi:hypothetical protein